MPPLIRMACAGRRSRICCSAATKPNPFAHRRSRNCSCRRQPHNSSQTTLAIKTSSRKDPIPHSAQQIAAAGIPAGFTSNVVNATVAGTTSGNTALESEVAFSKTFGVVLRPRFVPKLNISVDYIDIALKDAIESLTLTDNLDACYDSTNYPNNPACSTFTRNAAGQITDFHAGYVNAGLLEFTGIQAALDYTVDLPWSLGSLQTSAHYLDTQRLKSQIATAAPLDISGQIGYSKSKGSIDLVYANKGFSWDWQGIFVGPAQFSNQNTPTSQNILGGGSWWLINL